MKILKWHKTIYRVPDVLNRWDLVARLYHKRIDFPVRVKIVKGVSLLVEEKEEEEGKLMEWISSYSYSRQNAA